MKGFMTSFPQRAPKPFGGDWAFIPYYGKQNMKAKLSFFGN